MQIRAKLKYWNILPRKKLPTLKQEHASSTAGDVTLKGLSLR